MDFLAFNVRENLSTFVGCDDETGERSTVVALWLKATRKFHTLKR